MVDRMLEFSNLRRLKIHIPVHVSRFISYSNKMFKCYEIPWHTAWRTEQCTCSWRSYLFQSSIFGEDLGEDGIVKVADTPRSSSLSGFLLLRIDIWRWDENRVSGTLSGPERRQCNPPESTRPLDGISYFWQWYLPLNHLWGLGE